MAKSIDFMAAFAVARISVQTPGKKGGGATREGLDDLVRTFGRIGEICQPRGILPCLHPHANTLVRFESGIDFVMARCDPGKIAFGSDSAHLAVGRCDPVEIFRRYARRIAFVHLKNVRKNRDVRAGETGKEPFEIDSDFLEMGEGDVDFPAVFEILDEVGCDGYLAVEPNRSRTSQHESAFQNIACLKGNFFPRCAR